MLVLTRKYQEQIRIGDNITISILRIKGNTVRVGIEAPREVRVLRGELPIFDETVDLASEERGSAETTADSTEEEPTVSELEWEILKRLSKRKRPCLPVRRCIAAATKRPAPVNASIDLQAASGS